MINGRMYELFCHFHLEGHHQNFLGVLPVCQLKNKSGTKALTTSVWWPGSQNKKNVKLEIGQLLLYFSKTLAF